MISRISHIFPYLYYRSYQYYEKRHKYENSKSSARMVVYGLDIAVTIGLCALGGPVGWGIGIVYIGADLLGVQDWAIDNAYYLFNPEEKAREEKYK